ncbi:MAG: nucleotidyl transferase AbiEii/AbiGii toxin family protein, partial [Candidatus Thermoplasmatota archaeon]|nr:nucleotidyl transferase AbiEii/AbiGii toxin family protein [Candidatus Thermoplasmatota archaeon]
MISKNELKKIAKISGLNIYQQEKDYLLKLFLYFYYKTFEDAIFKGETCIRYLYGLPRFSEDIDFNITISSETFQKQIHSTIKKIELIGIKTYFLKEEIFKHAYTCEIGFQGPLYNGTEQTRNKIRIDAGKRMGTIMPAEWKLIQSEYPETKTNFLVKAIHEEEILIEKIITLINRKKGRDLYDVWFLLEKQIPINKELFFKKTR